jgi:hypothetical protein
VAAGFLGLALIVNLVAWCPCVQVAARAADDHGCCAPPAGWQAASDDCCSAMAPASQVTAPDRPADCAQSTALALASRSVAALHVAAAAPRPRTVASLVLRI